jgi:hypothetical protein
MNHTEHGDRAVATRGEILRTVVGSGVHGLAIAGTDDHDEMGVYIEPPSHVVGLREPVRHYVFRTQPEGARSGPGDTDLVSYSLHKYLRLATKWSPPDVLRGYRRIQVFAGRAEERPSYRGCTWAFPQCVQREAGPSRPRRTSGGDH